MSRLFAVTILDSPGEPDQRLEAAHRLGEPSNLIFGNFWDFVPTEGGGSANPNFFKTKTTTIQNSDYVGILSQYGGGFQSQPLNHQK